MFQNHNHKAVTGNRNNHHNNNNLLGKTSNDNTFTLLQEDNNSSSNASRIIVDEKPIANVKMTFEELLESKLQEEGGLVS